MTKEQKEKFAYWLTNNLYINKKTADLIVSYAANHIPFQPPEKTEADTRLLLDWVLPEGSLFYKHNHCLWEFFINDTDFEKGNSFSIQVSSESFDKYIKRTINELMDKEEQDKVEEPLVTIDYAIHALKKQQP